MKAHLKPHAEDAPVQKDRIIKGHKYDGIREYDNPMPSWWVWLFVGCIAFSAVYVLGLHVFGYINSYEDDLAQSRAQLALVRAEYARANPTFEVTEASLQKFVDDATKATAGQATFATYCASCHGDKGQGLIGPNLTDKFWINGGKTTEIFTVVTDGVAAKGMPAWSAALTPESRAETVAYIMSIQGTNPAGAKEPQGEPVE